MKSSKREKESSFEVKSNKTTRDYYDDEDVYGYDDYGYEAEGYVDEWGSDYGSYYDDDKSSVNDRLGIFRSGNKGNHLPSKSYFPCLSFNRVAFSRILSKGVPRSGRNG